MGRLAFAPPKNGRLGADADAAKMSYFFGTMLEAMGPQEWSFDLFLDPPFDFAFPAMVRGACRLRMWVAEGCILKFPVALIENDAVRASELGASLLRCFQAGFLDTPLLDFVKACFCTTGVNELQRQLAWSLAVAVEVQLGVACHPCAIAQDMQGEARLHMEDKTDNGREQGKLRDIRLVNYWRAGQQEAKRHQHLPWSMSFDGTRVGGRSVLASVMGFPTNRAFWAPILATLWGGGIALQPDPPVCGASHAGNPQVAWGLAARPRVLRAPAKVMSAG